MKRTVIALALALAAPVVANAQQITIRWGDVVAGTHPSVQMIDRIAADAKAKSNGRIVIQSFPGGQLGGSRDMIDAVANGAQHMVTEARGCRRSRSRRRRTCGVTQHICRR